jgi:thioredoxin 1
MTTQVRKISTDAFGEVTSSQRPVLVDFYADWCGPCKAIAPMVEELANEYADALDVRKVDVDRDPQLAGQFGIRGIPTLILFKHGVPVKTVVGSVSKAVLAEAIERHAVVPADG